jgi:hypothetical protein
MPVDTVVFVETLHESGANIPFHVIHYTYLTYNHHVLVIRVKMGSVNEMIEVVKSMKGHKRAKGQ